MKKTDLCKTLFYVNILMFDITVYCSIVYQQDCRQLDCSIIPFQVNNGTSANCKFCVSPQKIGCYVLKETLEGLGLKTEREKQTVPPLL